LFRVVKCGIIFRIIHDWGLLVHSTEVEKRIFSSFIPVNLSKFSDDSEIQRRAYVIHFTLLIGFFFIVALGFVALFEGNKVLAYTDFIIAVVIVFILIHFHITKSVRVTTLICVCITGAFFFWLLINGGTNNTAFVWYYSFPLFAVFFTGAKRGLILSVLMGIAAGLFFIYSRRFPSLAQYPLDFMLRFIPSYYVLVLFAYISEYFRDRAQRQLTLSNESLEFKVQERTAELLAKNIQLELASSTDALTGIANRLKLDEILKYELNRAKRYRKSFCILLIDIDYFKKINDAYGHLTGDGVLIKFAELLKSNIRETDTVGRWGGEEFMIVCPESPIESCIALAEKLRDVIVYADILKCKVTASFGVTCFQDEDDSNTLVKRADDALYKAKKDRNTCCSCVTS